MIVGGKAAYIEQGEFADDSMLAIFAQTLIWTCQTYIAVACSIQRNLRVEASQDFLQTTSYAAYLKDVEPLLAGTPQVTTLTPMWSKAAQLY
jgi:hypothetical protein